MTRFWKKGAAALGALAAAGALVVTAPAADAATAAKPEKATTPAVSTMSAQAKAAYYSCPNSRICIYQYKNFKGKKSVIKRSHRSLGFWNNRISSVINRTTYPICVYNKWHYYGRFPGHPHTQYYWARKTGGNWGAGGNLVSAIDNRVSSYRFAPGKKTSRC